MEQEPTPSVVKPARVPWNKGKLVGAKPSRSCGPPGSWCHAEIFDLLRGRRDTSVPTVVLRSVARWEGPMCVMMGMEIVVWGRRR